MHGHIIDALEIGWIGTGVATCWNHLFAQTPNLLDQQTQNSWMLVIGFIATGMGMIGAKAIELYQKWRQANSGTDHQKLVDCLEKSELLKIDYEKQLAHKAEEIEFLRKTITDLAGIKREPEAPKADAPTAS